MEMLEVRLRLGVDELLDAAEDIEHLLYRDADGDLSPTFRGLLFALDETITEAYRSRKRGSIPDRDADVVRSKSG